MGRGSSLCARPVLLHLSAPGLFTQPTCRRPDLCDGEPLQAPAAPHNTIHAFLQAGWWMIFGFWSWQEVQRIYTTENADCFWDLGAHQVCDSTMLLSIFSSMFLLMTQALLSRIFVPGKSSFVNASVRPLLLAPALLHRRILRFFLKNVFALIFTLVLFVREFATAFLSCAADIIPLVRCLTACHRQRRAPRCC